MTRNPLLSIVLILAFAATMGGVIGNAQTKRIGRKPFSPTFRGVTDVSLVDLNRASKADLMRLPGIGEADARQIIAGRPYQAKNELVDKKILSAEIYAKISGRVIATEK
jgi:DNA uptake protein ComE-like DNA-binding protein